MRESDPLIDAKTLFAGIVKNCKADCILDVGSRDGDQSLFFRDLAPQAHIAAFEANPVNYRTILAKNLDRRRIEVFPYAVSNTNGTATFFVADPASDPHAVGASSLLSGGYPLKEKIEVETRRLDDFVLEHYPDARKIVLWIDVEGAEGQVLEGLSKIRDRVIMIYTETSIKAVRENQKTLHEIIEMVTSWGFVFCGSNIKEWYTGGDVLFLNAKTKSEMGIAYHFCFMLSRLYNYLPIGDSAVYLKQKFPLL
ncbi:MAG TPA: FkbM family methyltransferase, partial [Candidatus Methylacidiphilales bacterium]|nr:FkbM family methyltransferase [Candidatus Methylacidiphilales bacterium]